jgi:hypothetical protein
MNDLRLSHEPETGQVVIDGRPAGPAGEAGLARAEGVDLAFDRVDGHLVRATVDAGSALAAGLLTRLFGPQTTSVLREAESAEKTGLARPLALAPEPGLCAALSALARLDAARATSPVATSPWWAAEAAVLAEAAGLRGRALADAGRAVRALGLGGRLAVPGDAARAVLSAADIAASTEPGAARQLRESIVVNEQRHPPDRVAFDVAAEVACLAKDCVRPPGPQWVLDPGLAPAWLFRPGLTPHSDLRVRLEASGRRVVVEATPAAGAQPAAAGRWHARLVDPADRQVLALAGFRAAGSRLQAEFELPSPLTAHVSETWVEVVEDGDRPVRSAQAHLIQRALRWADAALRAGRAPAGLAPWSSSGDWSALADLAWERCVRDWAAVGDKVVTVPVSQTTPPGPACLAEILGE